MVRDAIARRIVRVTAGVWFLLLMTGLVFRLPYSRPPTSAVTLPLSLGILAFVMVGCDLWTGVVHERYGHTVRRSRAPSSYWVRIAVEIAVGASLIVVGVHPLLHRG